MKKNKKGFTIVELVIVIAVIGILAAVLIPTFTTVVDNAKRAGAQEEARNAIVANMAMEGNNGELDGEDLDDKWTAYVEGSSSTDVVGYVYTKDGYYVAYSKDGAYIGVADKVASIKGCENWTAKADSSTGAETSSES